MLDVELLADAEDDLGRIWLYLSPRNESAARKVIGRIFDALAMLAHHPRAGRSCESLGEGLRLLPVAKYVVIYCLLPDRVQIVAVVDGRRDLNWLVKRRLEK